MEGPQNTSSSKNHSGIQRDVILDLYVVSYGHFGRNHDVLADIAVATDLGSGHDMAEMPDLCTFSNLTRFVYEVRLMHEKVLLF